MYFIYSPGDPQRLVKIGRTRLSMEVRLKQLQTASPFPLRVIATLEGGSEVESQIHTRFAKYRVHGEWFLPSSELDEFLLTIIGPQLRGSFSDVLGDPVAIDGLAAELAAAPETVRAAVEHLLTTGPLATVS